MSPMRAVPLGCCATLATWPPSEPWTSPMVIGGGPCGSGALFVVPFGRAFVRPSPVASRSLVPSLSAGAPLWFAEPASRIAPRVPVPVRPGAQRQAIGFPRPNPPPLGPFTTSQTVPASARRSGSGRFWSSRSRIAVESSPSPACPGATTPSAAGAMTGTAGPSSSVAAATMPVQPFGSFEAHDGYAGTCSAMRPSAFSRASKIGRTPPAPPGVGSLRICVRPSPGGLATTTGMANESAGRGRRPASAGHSTDPTTSPMAGSPPAV